MADEFTLCPPIPFTEAMQGVQLSDVTPGAFAELFGLKLRQVVLLRELGKDRLCAAFDVTVMREPVPAFAYVRGAKLPGPFVHIAE